MQVYRIYNKINGKSYIGITKWTFKVRYPQEKWWRWTHSNHLKKAVEKYNLQNFNFEILWNGEVDYNQLIEIEEMFIKQYNSIVPNGYNLMEKGSNCSFKNIKEYELIDIYGNVYKIKNLSNFCNKNKLNYSAILNMVSELSVSSQGFALSSTDVKDIKDWTMQHELENLKTKEIITIKKGKLHEWARKNKIKPHSIKSLINHKIKTTGGWKLKTTILDEKHIEKGQKYKNIKLLNPKGECETIENIYDFCKKNNLERGAFYNIINGKSLSYKGWRLPLSKEEFKKKQELKLGKKTKVLFNDEVIEIKNVSAFCRNNDLNLNNFYSMLKGRIKEYKGFKKND
jgi:hypothetical protein